MSDIQSELPRLLEGACAVAERACALLVSMQAEARSVARKQLRDIVTDADLAAEKLILEGLRALTPGAEILAEEAGAMTGEDNTGIRWIVDPLDGTINYANGLPMFSVTLTAQLAGETVLGVVQSPRVPLLATLVKGERPLVNGQPAHVSSVASLADAVVCVSMTASYGPDMVARSAEIIRRLANCARGVRVIVSGALETSLVAAGQIDAFIGLQTDIVSHAAGMAMVRAAGGTATTFSGDDARDEDAARIISNGHLHEALLREIADV